MAYNVFDNLKSHGVDVDIISEFRERKGRYIDSKSGQQLMRVDSKIHPIPVNTSSNSYDKYDAIVVSDYNKGTLSYEAIENLRDSFNGPIFIDTKKSDLARFKGCFVKINQFEYEARISDTPDLVVTYGSDKVVYNGSVHIPPKVETHDVCGAGDTTNIMRLYFWGYVN